MDIFTWQIQSASVAAQNGSSLITLTMLYIAVCFHVKKPVFLLAFLFPEMMFNLSFFDSVREWHLNSVEFIIYSYVFNACMTDKSKLACFIICYTAFIFGVDSVLYGVNGYYGERETIIYQNIALINSCAHLFLISSLVPIERIRNSLQRFVDSILLMSRNSAYIVIC